MRVKKLLDHCVIGFKMVINHRKRNQEKPKTIAWDFNDALGWEKLRM